MNSLKGTAFLPRFVACLAALLADGFESARRSPVDLSGGLESAVTSAAATKPARSNGFTASLNDL